MGNIERDRRLLDAFEAIGSVISEAGGQGDEAFDVIKDEISLLRDDYRGAVETLERLRKAADAWDATLSSYCDGPERDEVRAASLAASRVGGQ